MKHTQTKGESTRMSRYRKRRMRKELVKSSSKLEKMQKTSIILLISLFAIGVIVGGILWGVFNNLSLFFISIGISFGIFGFCMIGFVFWFLFSFSSGQIDVKEPEDENLILSETRVNLDMIAEANKMAGENKAKGKNVKPLLFLIYGWLFLTIIGTIVGIGLDQVFRPNKVPLYMFIGMGCFLFTLLGLIIFGTIIPNARIRTGSRKVLKSNFSHEIYATVKDVSFRSSTANSGGSVTETFMLTFETSYGASKCLYSIKNSGYGDTKTDMKRFYKGDKVLVLINPSNPKYCAIKNKSKN